MVMLMQHFSVMMRHEMEQENLSQDEEVFVIKQMAVQEYKDKEGKVWIKTHGCEYTKCGPNGEGSWCCRPGAFQLSPADNKCLFLKDNLKCSLHDSKLMRKPLMCMIYPLHVKDLPNCTVKWELKNG